MVICVPNDSGRVQVMGRAGFLAKVQGQMSSRGLPNDTGMGEVSISSL